MEIDNKQDHIMDNIIIYVIVMLQNTLNQVQF